MADQPVTREKLINADIDVDNLGKAVNELGVVTPRYGNPYKTAPQTIQDLQQKADQLVAQGFYKGYTTEALLLADKPAAAEMRARADDTRKIYRWNRTSAEGVSPVTGSWVDTGLSELDLAKADATTKANAAEANAKAHVDSMIRTDEANMIALSDNNGVLALRVANGSIVDIKSDLKIFDNLIVDSESVSTSSFEVAKTNQFSYAISDSDGAVIFALDKNGKVVNESASTSTTTTYKTGGTYDYEVNHVFNYGQSLSVGQATPAVSTTQKYDNLMFYRGMRPQYDYPSETAAQWYASLVPALEQQSPENSTLAETPSTGTGDAIKELMLAEDNLAHTDLSYQLLLSAPGYGATTIAQLSKGSNHYNRTIEQSQYGLSLANAQNKTYAVQAITWTQGESDYLGNNTQEAYYTAIRKLISDFNIDIKGATGQSKSIPLISYQIASHKVANRTVPNIALAQLQAETDDPLIYIACAMYQFTYQSSNNFHLDAISSRWLGGYYGLAYKRIVIDGEDWKPLKPTATTKQSNILNISFHVPHGRLVFDTTQVALNTNYGFELVDSVGNPLTISSVSIINPNTVKIVSNAAIPDGAKLRYAWSGAENVGNLTGPRGNLRDTQGDVIVFDKDGINKRLDNWCLIFETEV